MQTGCRFLLVLSVSLAILQFFIILTPQSHNDNVITSKEGIAKMQREQKLIRLNEQKTILVEVTKKPSINVATVNSPKVVAVTNRRKKALIFTMDSIDSYEANSLHGGAAGILQLRVFFYIKLNNILPT